MKEKERIEQLVIEPEYLPMNHITKIYGLSRAFLYQLKYERKIFHYSLGSRTFIKVSELEELIAKGKK